MLKVPAKLVLIIASLLAIVLGAHGIWVYFSRLELFFSDPSKLFLSIEVPARLQIMVQWMSFKGVESWVIPAGFVVLGLVLWGWQSRIHSDAIKLPSWLW